MGSHPNRMVDDDDVDVEHLIRIFAFQDDADNVKHHELLRKLEILKKLNTKNTLLDIREESCYYVASKKVLTNNELRQIKWLICPQDDDDFLIVSDQQSYLRSNPIRDSPNKQKNSTVTIEVGPRLSHSTAFSSNAVSILHSSCPTTTIYRLEKSTIYELTFDVATGQDANDVIESNPKLVDALYDPMVECIYPKPVETFQLNSGRSKMALGEPELQPCSEIDILARGPKALRDASSAFGLYFDDWDIDYYYNLFKNIIGRNPTVSECYDLAQSNSEHSRHWFFKGILEVESSDEKKHIVNHPHVSESKKQLPVEEGDSKTGQTSSEIDLDEENRSKNAQINKKEQPSLIDMIIATQETSNQNNLIKFEDNSSAIEGFSDLRLLAPSDPTCLNKMIVLHDVTRHIIFTAETHNFPTGVSPFPGAATGTGGRIRDVQATGRGAHPIAGTAGYAFGNLFLDNYDLDWENPHEFYPNDLAKPSKIIIDASNGASDYGNKYGEPIVLGFARSYGMRFVAQTSYDSERWEYLKPIMFTGGIGSIDDDYIRKEKPAQGMLLSKVGGPVYRIGMGGGAASSAPPQKTQDDGSNIIDQDKELKLNLNAVQRGDPEMEQKMNRVIRACIENRATIVDKTKPNNKNPILSIHDQGAGGNGNVLKELAEPAGAIIEADKFTLGDKSINILELWVAEYQESNAILIRDCKETKEFLELVSKREKCQVDLVGKVQSDGMVKLKNFSDFDPKVERKYPIDIKLDYVIGSMPRKTFRLTKDYRHEFLRPPMIVELDVPKSTRSQSIEAANYQQLYTMSNTSQMMSNFEHLLMKVLKLPSVASKRYLTSKVDRCVTGLIAGQQCLGPLHTPISDYALVSLSHFEHKGAVTTIGEQPIKGLVSPIANATMSVAEAITNMMFCVITCLEDVKCSANWMWPAKMPGEGARLVEACRAMCDLMIDLGIAVDGGKDSLSMSVKVDPKNSKVYQNSFLEEHADEEPVETVKSPGTLVISAYAPVEDIRIKVTPVLKCKPKRSHLIYVNLSHPIDCAKPGNKFRLGGSAILQTLGQVGDEAPTIEYPELLRDGFNLIQDLIREGVCTAGHDVSDGGLITCALEMAIASHCGIHLNIKAEKAFRDLSCANNDQLVLGALFSEECAVIIEIEAESQSELNSMINRFESRSIQAQRIGFGSYENQRITIKFEQQLLLEHENNHKLRDCWESTSKQLDLLQANPTCINQEYENLNNRAKKPIWRLSFDPNSIQIVKDFDSHYLTEQPKVSVLREEGINGDREMMASLVMAGFEVFDLTMTDLLQGASLEPFSGIIFPGGFSYGDAFGSGRGWAASLLFNDKIRDQLDRFRRRTDTFSLGVCNGCQLMSLLGFLDNQDSAKVSSIGSYQSGSTVKLLPNDSGRFECRWVNVRIEPTTDAIMLKNMEDSVFGVWIAHGQGKFKIDINIDLETDPRIAMKYVDDLAEPTMDYPFNPNGSDLCAAAMSSWDGRHLAMMPHPERCTLMWQWPYVIHEWTDEPKRVVQSPWMQMFVNAYTFCKQAQ